jgi:hypothetical protein
VNTTGQDQRRASLACVLALVAVAICFAALAPGALGAEPGAIANPCMAPATTPCDYCSYHIYSGDGVNVINAKGCFTNTILITYPVSSGCEGGANEIWELVEVTTGYRALTANYKGTLVCMIAGPESKQNAGAQPCTKPLQADMEFRRPVVSESCYSGFYYIIPATNYNLTLNVKGGLGQGRNINSYPQACTTNSVWFYEPA